MTEWTKFRVEDIAEKIAIVPYGSRMKSETYTLSGVPVIRGTNITVGRSFSGDWFYVSEADADQMANCNVRGGDLVFPHRGAIGEVAVEKMGDETLKTIAREVTEKLRNSTSVDWQKRESVRARLRNLVRITLRRYKYPPDLQEEAIRLVLEQAERLSEEWSPT